MSDSTYSTTRFINSPKLSSFLSVPMESGKMQTGLDQA